MRLASRPFYQGTETARQQQVSTQSDLPPLNRTRPEGFAIGRRHWHRPAVAQPYWSGSPGAAMKARLLAAGEGAEPNLLRFAILSAWPVGCWSSESSGRAAPARACPR